MKTFENNQEIDVNKGAATLTIWRHGALICLNPVDYDGPGIDEALSEHGIELGSSGWDSVDDGQSTVAPITNLIRVLPDNENNSEDFWNAVYSAADLGNENAKFLLKEGVLVTAADALLLLKFCEGLPGWEDVAAPDFAANPVLFVPCDSFKSFPEDF